MTHRSAGSEKARTGHVPHDSVRPTVRRTRVVRIGPGRAGVFVNLVPVFASFMAVAFLGEAFEFFHGFSLALVLSGIYVFEKFKPLGV